MSTAGFIDKKFAVGSYQLKTKEVGRAPPDRIVLTYLEKRWAMPTLQW